MKDIDDDGDSFHNSSSDADDPVTDRKPASPKPTFAQKLLSSLNPFSKSFPAPLPKEREPIPQPHVNWWSYVWFGWLTPIMRVGYKRPLQQGDLWTVDDDRRASVLADRVDANLQFYRAKKSKHALFWALNRTFFKIFWGAGLIKIVGDIALMTQPLVVRQLIQFANDAYVGEPVNISQGIGLAIGLAAMNELVSLCNHHVFYGMMITGAMSRASLITLIYRKTLVLSNRSKKTFTNARITNTMSTDTWRIDFASGYFHMIWTAPIQVAICLIILLINIGVPALAGFGLLFIITPSMGKLAKLIARWRVKSIVFTDARIRRTQEILSSMRIIKFYAWEMSFLDRLMELRAAELRIVRKLLTVRSAIFAVSLVVPVFASMLAFIVLSLTGGALTAANVFSSLSLFNLLRLPLMLLPLAFTAATDAFVALGRVQELLFAEETHERVEEDRDAEFAVEVDDADFTWETEEPEPKAKTKTRKKGWRRFVPFTKATKEQEGPEVEINSELNSAAEEIELEKEAEVSTMQNADNVSLQDGSRSHAQMLELERQVSEKSRQDELVLSPVQSRASAMSALHHRRDASKLNHIQVTVKRGELIGICGAIGSGKSSLLSAIVGDMRRTRGRVIIGGTVSFCPQSAWIQSATVRDNILFGQPFDQQKYDRVLSACALEADLKSLPFGDLTEIGERGVTLSGGQKARVAIARAAYFDTEIVCLDDVLSALDAHVGRHVFQSCVLGLMAGKTRILATHQLHFLTNLDRIIFMNDDGTIDIGSMDELKARNPRFERQVLAGGATESNKEENDEVEAEAIGDDKPKKPQEKDSKGIMQQEDRQTSAVAWNVYGEYARMGGGLWVIPFVVLVVAFSQGSNIVTNLWLSYWTSNEFDLQEGVYIGVYAGLGFLQAIAYFILGFSLTWIGNRSSRIMMRSALERIIRAPMAFFDTTPLGRIYNRFSKDVDTMDNNLSESYRMFLSTSASIIGGCILVVVVFYYFVIALIPLITGFIIAAMYYRASAREIKRLESLQRSTVFAHFGETLSGIAVIRAYGLQGSFRKANERTIDNMNEAYFLTIMDQRWLGLRVDVVGTLLIFVVGILAITNRFNTQPSITGLVLSYCLQIVGMLGWLIRMWSEVENNMNSTERIYYYGHKVENEAALTIASTAPPATWPSKGEVVMEDVDLRYRPGLPLVLDKFNLRVEGGARIGIVGRTGAGKTSILSALYRMPELSGGRILIDGVDVSNIGLHDLRFKLSIIPQDPVIFQGTIRTNLDPFGDRSDGELWDALRRSWLVDSSEIPDPQTGLSKRRPRFHLDTAVDDEGLNFSLGERQCLSLSRALVRRSKILILDEATSSVDYETDAKIQKTIVTEFPGCTLLCIAHRLRTIINYDRVCVLEAGKVIEYDTPLNLFEREESVFKSMCIRSRIGREDFKS